MKFILHFLFFVTIPLSSQNVETPLRNIENSFGIDFFGTNRLIFDNPFSSIPDFTQSADYIRELEVLSFRMGISFNLELPINPKKSVRIGLNYKWSGFGSKQYKPPTNGWNPIPDANHRKDRYNIHQFSIPIEYINYIKDSGNLYWIIGCGIVVMPSFSRQRVHVGNGSIVEGFVDSGEDFPTANISLKAGFGWNKTLTDKIKIKIEPYIKYYIVPYDTYRESNIIGSFSDNYLGLNKSKGNIYNLGLQVFIQFKKKSKI